MPRQGSVVLALITVLLMSSVTFSPVVADVDNECCASDDFDLFLLGDPNNGVLSPFESELDEEFEKLVTPSIQGQVEIGTWSIIWGTEGNYSNSTWEFSIPYEVEAAAGIQINATVGVNIGSNYYEGDAGAGLFISSEGSVNIPISVEEGEIKDGDKVKISFSVQSLSFATPGDEAGIRFLWGSIQNVAKITLKLPLVDIDIKDASVNGRLVYFPIHLKSGFDSQIWSSSTGGMMVANSEITESPISTPTEEGVEVTFVWMIPESTDSGTFIIDFYLIPQNGLRIEANRTFDITAGEEGGGTGSWYPAAEPLRTGGTPMSIDIEAKYNGNEIEKTVTLEFEGAMSQWMRWGLDNIGNDSLSSSSWWRNLRTYSGSIPDSDFHNGLVDDSELSALQGHLIGSGNDLKSFMANGLSLDAEAILGVNPVELGPTDITIDLGATRAFSSENIKITIDTSYEISTGERQLLIETFVRTTQEEYYDEIDLSVEIRSSALQGLGGMSAEDIDAKHRRWILLETITINDNELDSEKSFRVEFVPSGGALYSPLVSAMVCVFLLVIALGLGLFLTRKRSRIPSMLTVIVLGGLALSLYVLGLDIPFVLGVVTSSMLLVFPVALISPRTNRAERNKEVKTSHIKCPKCESSIMVESEVRPLRIPCDSCDSVLRLE